MAKGWLIGLTAALGILAAYLLFWPVSVSPESWTPPEPPLLTGAYAPNDALAGVETLSAGKTPESVAVNSAGDVFTGLLDGTIVRVAHGAAPVVIAETDTQLLGMGFDMAGELVVCGLEGRLMSVSEDGVVRELVRELNGVPLTLVNDLDMAADGTIYFSESSAKTTDTLRDMLEHRGDGRLLVYHPDSGLTNVLLAGLYFANGVAVSADESFVLVVETTKYRIRRLWLSGPRQGEDEIFIDNLPGFPDGISCDADGIFWLALVNPRNGFIDWALERPWIRKIAARLPLAAFASATPRYGFVLGLDADGSVIYNLQDPSGSHYAGISCVIHHGDFLYFGSLLEDAIGVLQFP